jgi:hypothetical protein
MSMLLQVNTDPMLEVRAQGRLRDAVRAWKLGTESGWCSSPLLQQHPALLSHILVFLLSKKQRPARIVQLLCCPSEASLPQPSQ